jgi:sialic acid synthase SpsE
MRPLARRKVVAAQKIEKGTMLTTGMLCAKRDPTGVFDAGELETLAGRKVNADIPKDASLVEADLCHGA